MMLLLPWVNRRDISKSEVNMNTVAHMNTAMLSLDRILVILLMIISSVQLQNIAPEQSTDASELEFDQFFEAETDSPSVNKGSSVCETDACRILANEFQRGMNTSINPCDNFYDYVCGAWNDQSQIPGYKAIWSRFHIFQDTVNRRIKNILETKAETTDIIPLRQAKKWYQACMDIDELEKRDIRPLESVLLQVGGWPMTLDPEEWNDEEHSWQNVEHDYFHITGAYIFYKFGIPWGVDFGVTVEKGSIPLHRKLAPKYRNYTGDDYLAYTEFIGAVAKMFIEYNKANVTDETLLQDVVGIVEFEKQLYLLAKSEDCDESEWTLGEFVEWYDSNVTDIELDDKTKKIDFRHLIRRQFDLVNRYINDSIPMAVDCDSYYVKLTNLLNITPSRTIVNYLHWHFVSGMLVYTTELMRDAYFELMKNEFDVKERSPRWMECIEEMKMGTASAYAFVQKFYSQEVENAVREIIQNIRQEMDSQIEASTWLDEESKTIAKEKLNAMKVSIGFPDWYKNQTYVSNAYKGLTIGHDHFDNVLSYAKYEVKRRLRYKASEQPSRDMMGDDEPITVNAYYDPIANSVLLPAADFQPPLFTTRVPQSVNWGIIGLAIGHEMGHAFDDTGILFGKDGNETKLSENMLELFNDRAQCFLDQFNNYFGETEDPESDVPSRGLFTRSDNMADSTGLQAVFKSFKKSSVESFKLPGFEQYTDDQMFFISFGAMWCETVTPKYEKKRKEGDGHSPGRFRVIGTLANLDEFAQAFNCAKGGLMNPEKKCNVWK